MKFYLILVFDYYLHAVIVNLVLRLKLTSEENLTAGWEVLHKEFEMEDILVKYFFKSDLNFGQIKKCSENVGAKRTLLVLYQ